MVSMNYRFGVLKQIAENYPELNGGIIVEAALDFVYRGWLFSETLENLASQPGINKGEFLKFLEKII